MANDIKKIRIGEIDYNIVDASALHSVSDAHNVRGAQSTSGLYKITTDEHGHVITTDSVTSSDLWGKLKLLAGNKISISNVNGSGERTISHAEVAGLPTGEGLYTISVDSTGHISGAQAATSAVITPLVNITGTGDTTVSNTNGTITVSSPAYTASDGIKRVNNEFKHTNSIDAGNTSKAAQTPDYGATFNIPVISYDAQGHITGTQTTTVQIPASDNTNQTVKVGSVTFGADDAVTFQAAGNQTTITGNKTDKTITIDTSKLESRIGALEAITGDSGTLDYVVKGVQAIKDELEDPTGGLDTVLDSINTVLNGSTSVDAITAITCSTDPVTYSTAPYLSVDNEVLIFNPGGVQGGETTLGTPTTASVVGVPPANTIPGTHTNPNFGK